MAANKLFFGDNLGVMREHIASESVDLVYLDPPFNSKRDYNLIFKSAKGQQSDAQITAFEDSWQWGPQAEQEYSEVMHQSNTDAAEVIQALRRMLGENDLLAYLTMMTNRLLDLHRVLKSTGSLYLHCDPTASHYLKIILDAVFDIKNFRNEIIWPRTNAHNIASRYYSRVQDIIFFYTKSDIYTWNPQYLNFSPEQLKRYFPDPDTGELITGQDLTMTGNPKRNFTWRGTTPPANRGWGLSLEELESMWGKGLILTKKDGTPRLDGRKVFLKDKAGKPLGSIWSDIDRIGNTSRERLGYPTQKPLELLERIIITSSNTGDLILDPFCGCGTAVHAAQKLDRRWVGIDITHLAISLIEKRLRDAFPGITFETVGVPKDLDGARDLAARDKYQFQWWACSLVNAQPYKGKKKGADGGTDGLIFFADDTRGPDRKIIVSVKGGENVGRTMVADLKNTVDREGAQIGLFVTLAAPTKPMITEAVSAGFYSSPHHGDFAKIQILTIEGLLSGRERPMYPDMARGAQTFKRAKTEPVKGDQQTLDLD